MSDSRTVCTALCFLLLVVPLRATATDFYIDPSAATDGDGTFASPWNTWSGKSISSGNDYRQKCGTTYAGALTITSSGTTGDHIIIGAYESDGDHEDAHPTYGRYCQDGVTAKPIIRDTNDSGNVVNIDALYITINSIEVQHGAEAIAIRNNHNIVEYCRLGEDSRYGVRIGQTPHTDGDYNIIRYNMIDLHDPTHANTQDGITFQWRAANNVAHNNFITRCGHGGIFFFSGDANEVYENLIVDTEVGVLWNHSASNNSVHHNCLDNTDMQLQGAQDSDIYSNVITNMDRPRCDGINTHGAAIRFLNEGQPNAFTTDNNRIYNNTIYNVKCRGINMYARESDSGGSIANNVIANNIILSPVGHCFFTNDEEINEINDNAWNKNLCFAYGTSDYASIDFTTYSSASAFNARVDATGNRDDDPGLADPAAGELWPDSVSDVVVGYGIDLGPPYDQILDPSGTDFFASPPRVVLASQPAGAWTLGAFAMDNQGQDTVPPADPTNLLVVNP